MPKEITHIHIASLIRERTEGGLRDLLFRHERAFFWGSVAPDLFYYDLRVPGIEEKSRVPWGEIIHGRDAEDTMAHILLLMRRALQARATDAESAGILFAFIAGYLTHVASDTVFHPFVYSISGNYYASDRADRKAAESRHRLFETGLDLHLLKVRGETLQQFALSQRLDLRPAEREILLTAFADSLREAHHPDLSVEHVRRVTRRAYRRCRILVSLFQMSLVVRLLILLNRMTSGRLGNFAHLGYGPHRALTRLDFAHLEDAPHPVTGQPLPGSVAEMVDQSCDRGMVYVQAVYRTFKSGSRTAENIASLRHVLRPVSLNNGLEGTPTRAMRHSRIHPALLAM